MIAVSCACAAFSVAGCTADSSGSGGLGGLFGGLVGAKIGVQNPELTGAALGTLAGASAGYWQEMVTMPAEFSDKSTAPVAVSQQLVSHLRAITPEANNVFASESATSPYDFDSDMFQVLNPTASLASDHSGSAARFRSALLELAYAGLLPTLSNDKTWTSLNDAAGLAQFVQRYASSMSEVTFVSVPDRAHVEVRGKNAGKTKFSRYLGPGPALIVVKKEGFKTLEKKIHIPATPTAIECDCGDLEPL